MKRSIALIAGALVLSLAACGGDDDDSASSEPAAPQKPTALSLTATEQGDRMSLKLSGEPKPGPATIKFTNEGKAEHEAQMLRIEGDHSQKEMLAALEGTGNGEPIPEWLRAAGGPGPIKPGSSTSVDVTLEPGTYYALDTGSTEGEGEGKPYYALGALTRFEVSGEKAGGKLPDAQATVSAQEYSFDAKGLKAGPNKIAFDNVGAEPHHMIAAPMAPGATLADVKKFFRTEKGRPPLNFEEIAGTSVIDGGTVENVELELKSGKYALLCFISDRAGGPPHVAKGMISEATVE